MISLKFKKRQKKLRLNRSQWPVYLLLSPMVLMYLEQSGLLYPGVPVVGGCVC